MDRDKKAPVAGARSNNGPLGSNSGGGLIVTQQGRKPLFGNAARQPAAQNTTTTQNTRRDANGRSGGLLQRAKSNPGPSAPAANGGDRGTPSSASPGGSRIPRMGSANSFGNRRPMSLAEAYKIAGEEDDIPQAHGPVDGSPSPAPRPWRNRAGGADEKSMRRLYGESPSKAAAAELKGKIAANHRPSEVPGSARTSRWVMQDGQRDSGIDGIPDLVPGIEDVPIQSVETSDTRVGMGSPEKSYAWQIDDDFTAGDLQVSDSPRIRVRNETAFAGRRSPDKLLGSRNTKLDEIRARELGRTKLDDIRAREQQAENLPITERPRPRIGHTKLDDIRKLELEGLSNRAIAAAKLEEIKEKNAMSRSISPEDARPRFSRNSDRPRTTLDRLGQRVPDTPVTIYKNREEADAAKDAVAKEEPRANGLSPERREQSRDLLRRLARAASSSPAPDGPSSPPLRNEKRLSEKSEAPLASSLRRTSDNARRTSNTESTGSRNTDGKPTVGFAGLATLSRSQSNESGKSKRSSMHSEQDPTDRIAGEAKLFAPMDNYSERGSVRAPSPLPDEEERAADATPKAPKIDPLSMPTPRVTGAYVETPATVKVERKDISTEEIPAAESKKPLDTAALFRDKKTSLTRRNKDEEALSDPGSRDKENNGATTRQPRARSLPRKRPPLKNSARPPSVRDDLLELQRLHNIDDDTIDNLEEILSGKKASSPRLQELLQNISAAEDEEVKPGLEELASEKLNDELTSEKLDDELAMYEKLGQSFKSGLGLLEAQKPKAAIPSRDTKKQAAKETTKQSEPHHTHKQSHQHADPSTCPLCAAQPTPSIVAYLHFPLPRLFYRTPTFRFTLLGLLLCVASLWYAAESAMCGLYCRPATCSGPAPCVWSFDDPTFGSALPIKLDQWTTGGYGRAIFTHVSEEALDWVADLSDQAVGRSIEDIDVSKLSFAQRQRHRRRLEKRGLLRGPSLPYDQRAKWESWRRERLAKERAKEARDMGYSSGYEEDSFGGDERVW